MSDTAKAAGSGVDQEGSTARTETPASYLWCAELFECPICNLVWAEVWQEGSTDRHICKRCRYNVASRLDA